MLKDKFAAGILAFTFGFLGMHWFYLGKRGLGFIYLSISIVTIFVSGALPLSSIWIGMVAIFYGVRFFVMSEEQFALEYNDNVAIKKPKNRYFTVALAFLVGSSGFHRFYLGGKNITIGFIYAFITILTLIANVYSISYPGAAQSGANAGSEFIYIFEGIFGNITTASPVLGFLLSLKFFTIFIAGAEGIYFLVQKQHIFDKKYNEQFESISVKKNQFLAGLLSFKLGVLGIHLLYVRHTMNGLTRMAIFSIATFAILNSFVVGGSSTNLMFMVGLIALGILYILGIVEGYKILNMSEKTFDKDFVTPKEPT